MVCNCKKTIEQNSESVAGSCALDQVEAATVTVNGDVNGAFEGLSLYSYFQPIFSLAHKRPVGYEALLRARDLSGSNVSPLEIFGRERSETDTTFLDRLCRNLHLRNFLPMADDTSWLFLNINPEVTVKGKQYGAFFAEFLELYRMPGSRVVVEILEGAINDEVMLTEAVAYYKALGCLVAIDDFGAGHSNFDRIWRLSPQIVKLDRSMIVQAAGNQNVRRVLPNLVNLIHESGSLSLMEGIETEQEAMIAMDSGIDFVQGYYFGRPEKLIPAGSQLSDLLPGLCDRFKAFSEDESKRYHDKLKHYVSEFRQSARFIKESIGMECACNDFFARPRIKRCFLLNQEGGQIGPSLISPLHSGSNDPRFAPLLEARDANWSRRHYFRRAISNPEEVQISRPYLSITDARMCVTLSVAVNTRQGVQVFCCDMDWNE